MNTTLALAVVALVSVISGFFLGVKKNARLCESQNEQINKLRRALAISEGENRGVFLAQLKSQKALKRHKNAV